MVKTSLFAVYKKYVERIVGCQGKSHNATLLGANFY